MSNRSSFAVSLSQGELRDPAFCVLRLESFRQLNTREDEYSDAIQLIRQIITGIRAVTPSRFVLGIKLNAGDYITGGVSEERALEHVRQIALLEIDFIEISGGDYENLCETFLFSLV